MRRTLLVRGSKATPAPGPAPTPTPAPATFDGRTWDYVGLTGPRFTFNTTVSAPAFLYPTTSADATAGTIKGDIDRTLVVGVIGYDPARISRATDYPSAVNIEGWPIRITDSEFRCSVTMTALPGVDTAIMGHCRIDPTQGLGPLQGALYRFAGDFDYSEIVGFYDGLWCGEYTRPVLLRRFAAGDFTSPYVSRVRYSITRGKGDGFGNSTYNPTYYNLSADPLAYPMSETGGTLYRPMTSTEVTGSITPSVSVTTAATVGQFVRPAPGYEAGATGINNGRWQIIGSTGGSRAVNAAVTIGTDMPTWPHASTTWRSYVQGEGTQPFISGTAILIYLGGANHSDNCQMGKANGHVLFYRSRFDQFSNAATFIAQPTNSPAGESTFDPAGAPTSYLRVEECDVILDTGRARVAYVQGAVVVDPITGMSDYPAYGYKSPPRWVTFLNNWIGNADGTAVSDYKKLYYNSTGRLPVTVATEAQRYTAVLAQLDATGAAAMTTANGGTAPTGTQIAASETLQAALLQQEYLGRIYLPTDGYNGLPDNISGKAVFSARLAAKIPKPYLDARTWVVWQGNKDRTTGATIHPNPPAVYLSRNPWLAQDGSSNGYHTGT